MIRTSIRKRIRRVFALPVDEDVRRELEFHLEMRALELEEEGWSAIEARHEAARLFGDRESIASDCRQITLRQRRSRRRTDMLDALRQDFFFGLRSLRRSPGFAIVALLTLALGIGATSAIFSVVDAVLFESLPYPEPERLVALWEVDENGREMRLPHRNFLDWQEQGRTIEKMALYSRFGGKVTVEGARAERLRATPVTADFFAVLGSEPILGRTFLAEESRLGAEPTVVVSHRFWQKQMGGVRNLEGATVRFRNTIHRVVGVLGPDFAFPAGVDLFYPMELSAQSEARTAHNWSAVGRLRADSTLEAARTELDAIARQMKEAHGEEIDAVGAHVRDLREEIVGDVRRPLMLLLLAAGMVLLVAASNLASTLLARAVQREREMAIRSAIGAGHGRVARQLLTESVTLTLLGGLLGLAVAQLVLKVLVGQRPAGLPRLDEIGIDSRILLFTLGISVLTGLVFGLFPVLRILRSDLNNALAAGARHGGRRRGRAWNLLVAAEVGLALVLLVGSGLLLLSFRSLTEIPTGFEAGSVLTLEVSPPDIEYPSTFDPETLLPIEARMAAFYDDLLHELEGLPTVEAVGLINELPLGGSDSNGAFVREGWDLEDYRSASYRVVGGDYLEALRIPLIRGRFFDGRDVDTDPAVDEGGAHVVLVNEEFVRRYFPGEDPVGQKILSYGMDIHWTEWMTIVGVVGDVRQRGLRQDPSPEIWVPVAQRAIRAGTSTLVLKSKLDADELVAGLAGPIRERLTKRWPNLPVEPVPMQAIIDRHLDRDRFSLGLIGAFALLALGLAALGIYGVVGYSVARRTRELGIRLALGAAPGQVVRQVMLDVLGVVALGMVFGVAGAYFLGRALGSQLHGVEATDPVAFLGMAAVLAISAMVASWLPAKRATTIDPTIAMRAE